jgi:hypothetical protein
MGMKASATWESETAASEGGPYRGGKTQDPHTSRVGHPAGCWLDERSCGHGARQCGAPRRDYLLVTSFQRKANSSAVSLTAWVMETPELWPLTVW